MLRKLVTCVQVVVGLALVVGVGAVVSAGFLGLMILMFFGGKLGTRELFAISSLLFPLMLWCWGIGLPGGILLAGLLDGLEGKDAKTPNSQR